jgi:hypothetical protein
MIVREILTSGWTDPLLIVVGVLYERTLRAQPR